MSQFKTQRAKEMEERYKSSVSLYQDDRGAVMLRIGQNTTLLNNSQVLALNLGRQIKINIDLYKSFYKL